MILRRYTASNCEETAQLFYQTVHTVNAADYSEAQRNAWATDKIDLKNWHASLAANFTVVALENRAIVGFGDIESTGFLNRLFVHKDCQRRGIATAICDALEKAVKADTVVTHASITAKTFFEKRGYRVLKEQQVIRNGVALTNYVMKKKMR